MATQFLMRNPAPWKRLVCLLLLCGLLATGAGGSLAITRPVKAAVDIYASPVNASCYLAKLDRCKIHVEPFTINLTPGTLLVRFQLVANRLGGNPQVIYDFRPDASNPAPYGGASTYTPTLVKRDFAASCSASYTISLQGEDTGDNHILYNLGTTTRFTCPKGTFMQYMPSIRR